MKEQNKEEEINMSGKNVFVDFSIIEKSNIQNLVKELDILIACKKYIYVWSKTTPIIMMHKYCASIIVKIDENELNLHKKVRKLKALGKTYKDIIEETGADKTKIHYYIKVDPNIPLTLDNWIVDYYQKDSSIYDKVDIVIDPDKSFVNRFINRGKEGNVIEYI